MLGRRLNSRQEDGDTKDGDKGQPQQPPRKLARRAAAAGGGPLSSALRVRESALFRPVRAIGMVTDELPITQVSMGDQEFIVAGVRRGFQVFNCQHLRVAFIGPRLNEKVRSITAIGEVVLTAVKGDIIAWHKLVELGRFRGHTASATAMCSVGTAFLVSAAEAEVLVWQLSDIGLQKKTIEEKVEEGDKDKSRVNAGCILSPLCRLELGEGFGDATVLCHLPTYLHKVLIGSSNGRLGLWNVRSQERVYEFQSHLQGSKSGAAPAVTCIAEAPHVLDLVAVGFADGRICVMNAKEDKVILRLDQAQGRVTSLSFRTGPNAPAHLVSGAPNGAFVVWDLEKRRSHFVMDGAHIGPVSAVRFLPNQPLLSTSGRDNAIRMWIFDSADGVPRLLRSRCGCPGPARHMAFYGEDGDKEMIVAGGGKDAGYVSRVSFVADNRNREYSQGALKKMPAKMRSMQSHLMGRLTPAIDSAFCEARHYDWPAVLTAHDGCDTAYIWSAEHAALAPKALKRESVSRLAAEANAAATAVAISPCGNYCAVGYADGYVHRFNMQSGLHRGPIPEAPPRDDGKDPEPLPPAHLGRVCGVAISVSGCVLSVGSHPGDCALKVWRLMTHKGAFTVPLKPRSPGASAMRLRMQGSLVAIPLDSGELQVVDLNSEAVVRSFACGIPATDVAFSGDGRWLAAALRNGGLRVFDLLAARCVDSFMFARPALAVCFAPSGAFLVTSHSKGNSLQVWANKYLFDPSLSAPLLRAEPKEPINVDEPGAAEEDIPDTVEADAAAEDEAAAGDQKEAVDAHSAVVPLQPELLTLSDVPPSKWQATLHLDVVKERNKPKEAPKPLPNAPFFLPTTHEGVVPRFAAPMDAEAAAIDHFSGGDAESKVTKSDAAAKVYAFQALIRKGSYDKALEFLRAQTPSGVHLAIEEMGPLAGGGIAELRDGIRFFQHHVAKAHFADELQAFLSIFLQAHGEELAEDKDAQATCAELCQELEGRWSALNRQCQKVRCFLGMLTHTQSQW